MKKEGGVDGVAGAVGNGVSVKGEKKGGGEGLDKVKKEESAKEREVREKREKATAQAQLKELKRGQKELGRKAKDVKAEGGDAAKAPKDKAESKKGKKGAAGSGGDAAQGLVKAEKEGVKKEGGGKKKDKRKGGRLSDDDADDAIDWTEQYWPTAPPPSRYTGLPQATLHREMRHVVTTADYFAVMRAVGRARAIGMGERMEERMEEKNEEWMWAVKEGERGYIRVPHDDDDESSASVPAVLQLIRKRERGLPLRSADEQKEEEVEEATTSWLDPANSLAYLTSSSALPSVSALRGRCQLLVRHGGLKGVTEPALHMIQAAMEQYVQRIVCEMVALRTSGDIDEKKEEGVTVKEEKEDAVMRTMADGGAVAATSTVLAPASAPSDLPSAFPSFPASCFAPSIFTVRPAASPAPASRELVESSAAERGGVSAMSIDGTTAPTGAGLGTSGAAQPPQIAAPPAPAASSDAAMQDVGAGITTASGKEGAAAPAPAGSTEASSHASAPSPSLSSAPQSSSSSSSPSEPPPLSTSPSATRRVLSVSVPQSPPSSQSNRIHSPTPLPPPLLRSTSLSFAPSPPSATEEPSSFPFLIAQPSAYRPQPRVGEGRVEARPMEGKASRPMLGEGDSRRVGVDGAVLSLSDLLVCLSGDGVRVVRLADDLPLLLERLLIVH